jgi:hypothetical protein
MKTERDYSHEHKVRKERKKRIHADIDRYQIDKFREFLKNNNVTFTTWLVNKMNEEIGGKSQ